MFSSEESGSGVTRFVAVSQAAGAGAGAGECVSTAISYRISLMFALRAAQTRETESPEIT